MDAEDIITLVLVLILAIIPKKKKQILEPDLEPEPLDNPDVSEVRKRIEAMKRQRNTNSQPSQTRRPQLTIPHSPVKQSFSAYKHLPKQIIAEENVLSESAHLPEPKVPVVQKSVNNIQKNIANKKTKLHEWIIGQVVLDSPAFRKNYGNFFNR